MNKVLVTLFVVLNVFVLGNCQQPLPYQQQQQIPPQRQYQIYPQQNQQFPGQQGAQQQYPPVQQQQQQYQQPYQQPYTAQPNIQQYQPPPQQQQQQQQQQQRYPQQNSQQIPQYPQQQNQILAQQQYQPIPQNNQQQQQQPLNFRKQERELVNNPCIINPCKNGGSCDHKVVNDMVGFRCACIGPWSGPNCDQSNKNADRFKKDFYHKDNPRDWDHPEWSMPEQHQHVWNDYKWQQAVWKYGNNPNYQDNVKMPDGYNYNRWPPNTQPVFWPNKEDAEDYKPTPYPSRGSAFPINGFKKAEPVYPNVGDWYNGKVYYGDEDKNTRTIAIVLGVLIPFFGIIVIVGFCYYFFCYRKKRTTPPRR